MNQFAYTDRSRRGQSSALGSHARSSVRALVVYGKRFLRGSDT